MSRTSKCEYFSNRALDLKRPCKQRAVRQQCCRREMTPPHDARRSFVTYFPVFAHFAFEHHCALHIHDHQFEWRAKLPRLIRTNAFRHLRSQPAGEFLVTHPWRRTPSRFAIAVALCFAGISHRLLPLWFRIAPGRARTEWPGLPRLPAVPAHPTPLQRRWRIAI